MLEKLPRHCIDIRRDWSSLALYERFETSVAYVLTLLWGSRIGSSMSDVPTPPRRTRPRPTRECVAR
jgi:hypothetical protein